MTDPNLWTEIACSLRTLSQELHRLAELIEQSLGSSTTPQKITFEPFSATPDTEAGELMESLYKRLEVLGVSLVGFTGETPSNPTDRQRRHLARFMVENYSTIEPIMALMRSTLSSPSKMYYNLGSANNEQISIIAGVCTRLYDLYFLDYYEYLRTPRRVRFRVRKQPFAQNFLSGGWFEMGVAEIVAKNLSTIPHILLRNARLQMEKGGNFEVDLLIGFKLQGEFCLAAIECKSAGLVSTDEITQIRRVGNVLNLGILRHAVVFPKSTTPQRETEWCQMTGANIITISDLPNFLKQIRRC
ncbi:MAG: hypothetical protein ACUVR1_00510 [Fimbriimonadales bacterium]